MSIWNKILLGLIFVATLAFFHAAARTVKTYQYWANKTNDFENALAKRDAEVLSLKKADHEHPRDDKTIGVEQLRIDLGRVLANRGRIWTKCEKQKAGLDPDPKNPGVMLVTVSTDEAAPAFAKNMLLYAFEEGDDQSPGKYLGEFRVDAVSEKKIVLASTTQMLKSADATVKSLADHVMGSKTPWVLYEMMPTDEHEAFVDFPEDQRKGVPDEFLKDGQDFAGLTEAQKKLARDGQPDAAGKKLRLLRDYLEILRACEMHRTLFVDRLESATRDLAYLNGASLEAIKQEELAEKEKTRVTKELARAKAELEAVANLNASRENMLNIYQLSVKEAIANNLRYAQEIAKLQKEAADKVDRRMRNLAQFGPRAN